MRLFPLLGASALICLAIGPALPQSEQQLPIATVTCGDIAGVPAAYQAALIFYAAGYRDGLDYARAVATTAAAAPSTLPANPTISSEAAVASAPEASSADKANSPAETTAGGTKIVGGLVLQVQDVVAACASAPRAFLSDIIANHGGARGPQGSPSAAVPAVSTPGGGAPADSGGVAPASAAPGVSQPAPATTTNSGTSAVSADLGAATQQLQQNLAPSVAPGATPPPGTTPGATTPGAATSP
jgi:hypothetical protein